MAQSDKAPGLTVVARAGVVFVVLAVGAAVLALIVRPAAVPTFPLAGGASARGTRGAENVIILPPLGSQTPWPGGTPAPTATTRQPVSPTPEPPADTRAPAAGSVVATSTGAPVTPQYPAEWTSSPAATSLAPSLEPSATPTLALPPGTLPPAQTSTLSETPVAAPNASPTVGPSDTPLPPSFPVTYDDLVDLEAYLRAARGTIAGQPLEILALTRDASSGAVPRFELEVAGSEADNVFAAQSAPDVLAYGRSILDDVKRYVGDQPCGITIVATYQTPSTDACSAAPVWCEVGASDDSTGTWTVSWTYVRGSYTGESSTVEAWNAVP